ncbi:hypothetical protein DAI22_05g062900 [Oryza sativa Japonica Group]|nr:hypothetical protein DAI22_05g062900 [Oryza sativa Japonica Group]
MSTRVAGVVRHIGLKKHSVVSGVFPDSCTAGSSQRRSSRSPSGTSSMAAARPISPARSADTSASLAATCRHHPTPSQLNFPFRLPGQIRPPPTSGRQI